MAPMHLESWTPPAKLERSIGHGGINRATPIVSVRGLVSALDRRPFAMLLFVIAILRIGATWYQMASTFSPMEFSIYYCSAVTLRGGGDPYRTDMHPLARTLGLEKEGYVEQTNNPPTFLVALEPLAMLSPPHAYWAWQLVNATAFALALFLLLAPKYSGLSPSMAWSLAALALLFPPVGNNFCIAQSKMLALLPLVAMMRLMERRRDALAGIMLGLTGLMHVFPLLLIGYLLLMRRWRAVAFTAGTILLGGIATLALMGFDHSLGFFSAVGALASQRWMSESSNISLGAFISKILSSVSGSHARESTEMIRVACIILADLVVMALVVKRTDWEGGEDWNWRVFSLWLVAAVMISPTAWFHYLLLLLIPFAQAAVAANRGLVSARVVWAMAAICLLIGLIGDTLRLVADDGLVVGQLRNLEVICMFAGFAATYWFALAPERTREEESWELAS